jgi:hypothetical protein
VVPPRNDRAAGDGFTDFGEWAGELVKAGACPPDIDAAIICQVTEENTFVSNSNMRELVKLTCRDLWSKH